MNSIELPDHLPDVEVRQERWPSPVWLIPLTALLIGLWLLFQTWYEKGPIITVQFVSAEGIESGKTEVRYKAVSVGKIRRLKLSDDLKYIEAEIELSREIGRHLGSDARFWIVSPRIGRSGVSGLTTFLSGTYVGMDPGSNNDSQGFYQGEDRPPVIAPSENGRRFFLTAESLGSLDVGAPVFYKQLQVGEVIDYKLLSDRNQVRLEMFVRDPYFDFVRTNSRFWNASGAEFSITPNGAEFRMESLTSMLVGGIAFDNPLSGPAAQTSEEGSEFVLYRNSREAQEKQFSQRLYYVLYFDGSVRGLQTGTPVEFQGIPVGQVEGIDLQLNKQSLAVRIPVRISIQPQQFEADIKPEEADDLMRHLVKKGLRAKIDTVSLVTGQKVITLNIEKSPPLADISQGITYQTQPYLEFPTTRSAVDDLPVMAGNVMASLQETLDGVKKLVNSGKLDKTVENLNSLLAEAEGAVKDAQKAIKSFGNDTLPGVNRNMDQISADVGKTLQKLQGSLAQIDRLTAQNSPTQYQINEMLEEVTAASRSVRSLAETLQRQPQSFLRGKRGE